MPPGAGRDIRWLYLYDEAPEIGCGWRQLEVVGIGPRRVHIRDANTPELAARISRDAWDVMARCERQSPVEGRAAAPSRSPLRIVRPSALASALPAAVALAAPFGDPWAAVPPGDDGLTIPSFLDRRPRLHRKEAA